MLVVIGMGGDGLARLFCDNRIGMISKCRVGLMDGEFGSGEEDRELLSILFAHLVGRSRC